jgi:uncharacterized protein YegP (UPF0339 family)
LPNLKVIGKMNLYVDGVNDMAQFVIRKNEGGQYWFVLKANNNKLVLQSQMYMTKQNAEIGIRAIKAQAFQSEIVDATHVSHLEKEVVESFAE